MPKTFQILQKDVASFVKLPNDNEALGIAGSGINDAINNLVNSRNWSFQVTTYNFALYATSGSYDVPSDFRQERNVSLLNTAGEVGRRVGYREPKIFDTRHQHGTSSSVQNGTPHHYTITDSYPSGVIRFDLTPDAGVVETYPSGQIMYYARAPELVASGAILTVPPEVESMILWYAKSYVAAMFAEDQVGFAESRWRPLYTQLKRNESNKPDWRL